MRKLSALLLSIVFCTSAFAQSPTLQWIDNGPQTLSTSPSQCVSADSSRRALTLHSLASNTTNILYCFRGASTPNTACTPNWTLLPNEKLYWANGSAPSNAMDCQAASLTPTLEVGYGK